MLRERVRAQNTVVAPWDVQESESLVGNLPEVVGALNERDEVDNPGCNVLDPLAYLLDEAVDVPNGAQCIVDRKVNLGLVLKSDLLLGNAEDGRGVVPRNG